MRIEIMRKSLAVCGLLLVTVLPAFAQTNEVETGGGIMGRMGKGMMMGMGPGMMMGRGDLKAMVEGRLAYVKTALDITDDEAP
jgi:hypothetical protein